MRGTEREIKTEIYRDNFQNYKKYGIPKAQLVIADIPYNLGKNAYGSNPMWYTGGEDCMIGGILTKLKMYHLKNIITRALCL